MAAAVASVDHHGRTGGRAVLADRGEPPGSIVLVGEVDAVGKGQPGAPAAGVVLRGERAADAAHGGGGGYQPAEAVVGVADAGAGGRREP